MTLCRLSRTPGTMVLYLSRPTYAGVGQGKQLLGLKVTNALTFRRLASLLSWGGYLLKGSKPCLPRIRMPRPCPST